MSVGSRTTFRSLNCLKNELSAGLLKREGVLSWVWEELQATAAMQFRFLNPVDPSDYATQLANSMHKSVDVDLPSFRGMNLTIFRSVLAGIRWSICWPEIFSCSRRTCRRWSRSCSTWSPAMPW